MKKTTWMLGAMAILGLTFASCSQEPIDGPAENGKQGVLKLSLNGKTIFKEKTDSKENTRALNESDYNNVSLYTVVVTNKDGREVLNCKGSEVASHLPLTLPLGNYSVKAFYGKETPASRNEFYVEGVYQGIINAEKSEEVTVNCYPTCGRIRVNFAPEMANYFSDYHVSFTGTQALGNESIAWLKDDTEPWYVQLTEEEETINYTITGVTKDEYVNGSSKEQTATKTGTFKLSRNKGYKMNIKPSYTPTDNGSVDIEIGVDDSTNDHEIDWEIPVG